jgi:hypothetical protein
LADLASFDGRLSAAFAGHAHTIADRTISKLNLRGDVFIGVRLDDGDYQGTLTRLGSPSREREQFYSI